MDPEITNDQQGPSTSPLVIMTVLFAILGISNVIASLSVTVINEANLIPQISSQSSLTSLFATAIRNTAGIILVLYLIGKTVVPTLDDPSETVYTPPGNSIVWTLKWSAILTGTLYGILILFSILLANLAEETDTSSVYDQFQTSFEVQIAFILLAVVFAPVFEELFFRRMLIPLLQNFGYSTSYAIGFSALLFSMSHVLGDITGGSLIIAILRVFVTSTIGVVLGIIYVKTRNIFYPILFHAINNAFSSALPLLLIVVESNPLLGGAILLVIFLILLIGFLYGVIQFIRNFSTIRQRTREFLQSMGLLSGRTKILLLTLSFLLLTVLPLLVISGFGSLNLSTRIGTSIYWLIVASGCLYYYKDLNQ